MNNAPKWRDEAHELQTLRPRHVLFLCVANSARSQLAEGIARSLAPEDVKISSAGSEPTSVRPQAVAVMAEIGIDISHHSSIGIDEVERPVDAVVTLCAEEVCPVWLGDAWRAHWGLPDPAGAGATDGEELDAFRAVRDELVMRLRVVFDMA
jgi:protein-tyrosine-phosphatase